MIKDDIVTDFKEVDLWLIYTKILPLTPNMLELQETIINILAII
jgi:hypothetical protein